ncbi:hypothetical protein CC2G_011424 [Coprinopsis cinerea AmutBmut pab1-1]|nr:hypothetical protein CC2G_011424 [Coprinopsis cinerea AmutBmut pab1-1]
MCRLVAYRLCSALLLGERCKVSGRDTELLRERHLGINSHHRAPYLRRSYLWIPDPGASAHCNRESSSRERSPLTSTRGTAGSTGWERGDDSPPIWSRLE